MGFSGLSGLLLEFSWLFDASLCFCEPFCALIIYLNIDLAICLGFSWAFPGPPGLSWTFLGFSVLFYAFCAFLGASNSSSSSYSYKSNCSSSYISSYSSNYISRLFFSLSGLLCAFLGCTGLFRYVLNLTGFFWAITIALVLALS